MNQYFYNETKDTYWQILSPVPDDVTDTSDMTIQEIPTVTLTSWLDSLRDDVNNELVDAGDIVHVVSERPNPDCDYNVSTGEWVPNAARETATAELVIRSHRDFLLKTVVDTISGPRWNSLTTAKQTEWAEYRQELLDVPQDSSFPDPAMMDIEDAAWPTKPVD